MGLVIILFALILKLFIFVFTYSDFFLVGVVVFMVAWDRLGIHTAIAILLTLAALVLLYFINQITVMDIYIFKILGALFSAYVVSTLFIVHDEYGNPDLIWQWVGGIIAFALILFVRTRSTGLVRKYEPMPPLQEFHEV